MGLMASNIKVDKASVEMFTESFNLTSICRLWLRVVKQPGLGGRVFYPAKQPFANL